MRAASISSMLGDAAFMVLFRHESGCISASVYVPASSLTSYDGNLEFMYTVSCMRPIET